MKMNMMVKVAAFVLATLFNVIQTGSILFVVVSTQGNQGKCSHFHCWRHLLASNFQNVNEPYSTINSQLKLDDYDYNP